MSPWFPQRPKRRSVSGININWHGPLHTNIRTINHSTWWVRIAVATWIANNVRIFGVFQCGLVLDIEMACERECLQRAPRSGSFTVVIWLAVGRGLRMVRGIFLQDFHLAARRAIPGAAGIMHDDVGFRNVDGEHSRRECAHTATEFDTFGTLDSPIRFQHFRGECAFVDRRIDLRMPSAQDMSPPRGLTHVTRGPGGLSSIMFSWRVARVAGLEVQVAHAFDTDPPRSQAHGEFSPTGLVWGLVLAVRYSIELPRETYSVFWQWWCEAVSPSRTLWQSEGSSRGAGEQ